MEIHRLLLDSGADLESLESYTQHAVFWSGWFGELYVAIFIVE
jgi:hypothetical protein